jgi:SOS-response transcriptional repressor LexA
MEGSMARNVAADRREVEQGGARIYSLKVRNRSMAPTARSGDTVIFSPALKAREGDEALIIMRKGPAHFRVVKYHGEHALLRAHHPDFGDILVKRADILRTARLIRIHSKA